MTKHRVAVGLAAALATSASIATLPAADAAPARPHTTSLAQVLATDGHRFDKSWGDFDILDKAVSTVLAEKPDSAVGVLAKGRTELTAFLPTDRAFRILVTNLTGTKPATERATFRTLAKAAGVDTIETVLLYHVVPGATLGSAKVLQADGTKLTTAQGGTVKVHGPDDYEGQQRVELPMLLDRMVADVMRTHCRHPVQDTGTPLDGQLTFVPG